MASKLSQLLKVQPSDKATGREIAEAEQILNKNRTAFMRELLNDDFETLRVLSWIIAKRDEPELKIQDMIDHIHAGNFTDISWEILYLFGNSTREEIEQSRRQISEIAQGDAAPPKQGQQEKNTANPSPSKKQGAR